MSVPTLDRVHPSTADPVVFRPSSTTALTLAAARADVVRLEFSGDLPDVADVRAAVAELADELVALGRPRTAVRVELEVDALVVDDARSAASTRTRFGMLDALTGVAPHVARGHLVGTATEVAEQVGRLLAQTGVDAVVLR